MSSDPSTGVVLVTGSNGYLGSAVTLKALEHGYHVRALVRREEAIEDVKRVPPLAKYAATGVLTLHVVPDPAFPGALDEVAAGCTGVIHVGAPMPHKFFGDLVSVTVDGAKAILAVAEATPSIKRVVFTSSIYALKSYKDTMPLKRGYSTTEVEHMDTRHTMTAEDRLPNEPLTMEGDAAPFQKYVAAKVAARNEILSYAASHKTSHVSIVNLMPGYILGPDIRARRKADFFNSTNNILTFLFMEMDLRSFWGTSEDVVTPLPGKIVALEDCAEAHVKALDPQKVPGALRNFLLCTEAPRGARWADAVDIIKEQLPEVAKVVPFASTLGTRASVFDTTGVESELLGRPLASYSKIVVDTMQWWYSLPDE